MTESQASKYLDQIYELLSDLKGLLLQARTLTQASPLGSSEEDMIIAALTDTFDVFDAILLPVKQSYIDWIHTLLHSA